MPIFLKLMLSAVGAAHALPTIHLREAAVGQRSPLISTAVEETFLSGVCPTVKDYVPVSADCATAPLWCASARPPARLRLCSFSPVSLPVPANSEMRNDETK